MGQYGWIGVDLDGTLAEYHGWLGGAVGKPIKPMVDRVKEWLAAGIEVRIMTARVAECGRTNDDGQTDDYTFTQLQRQVIEDWCESVFGQKLKVTATKDFQMVELWDDRAVQVETNTGRRLGPYKT